MRGSDEGDASVPFPHPRHPAPTITRRDITGHRTFPRAAGAFAARAFSSGVSKHRIYYRCVSGYCSLLQGGVLTAQRLNRSLNPFGHVNLRLPAQLLARKGIIQYESGWLSRCATNADGREVA